MTLIDTSFLSELEIKKENLGAAIGPKWIPTQGTSINSISPVDGAVIGTVNLATEKEYNQVINRKEI